MRLRSCKTLQKNVQFKVDVDVSEQPLEVSGPLIHLSLIHP